MATLKDTIVLGKLSILNNTAIHGDANIDGIIRTQYIQSPNTGDLSVRTQAGNNIMRFTSTGVVHTKTIFPDTKTESIGSVSSPFYSMSARRLYACRGTPTNASSVNSARMTLGSYGEVLTSTGYGSCWKSPTIYGYGESRARFNCYDAYESSDLADELDVGDRGEVAMQMYFTTSSGRVGYITLCGRRYTLSSDEQVGYHELILRVSQIGNRCIGRIYRGTSYDEVNTTSSIFGSMSSVTSTVLNGYTITCSGDSM